MISADGRWLVIGLEGLLCARAGDGERKRSGILYAMANGRIWSLQILDKGQRRASEGPAKGQPRLGRNWIKVPIRASEGPAKGQRGAPRAL